MQEVFGPKKKPRDSPAPGLSSLTHSLPLRPRRQQRYIGLCPNKSEDPGPPQLPRSPRIAYLSSNELTRPFHPAADAASVWGPTSGQQADTDELHGWGCTSCRPCTANIHALAQSGIRRATFWELPTLVLADRWVSPFGLRLMARQCGKMIEAPDVCSMNCAPILAGTGGRVERGLSPSRSLG